jgi:ubiquinone/menaquinone biosynthesis C-methylase UbiE
MLRKEESRMVEDRAKEVERIEKEWDDSADTYEEWYKTFEGAVETQVDLALLRKYLPKNKDAKILDAAGGTGRITLPLAKMGYSVTLCDISPRMLDLAKQKMRREGVYDKVKILECNIRKLYFPDESFDFVLCWDGGIEAAKELIRVTKKGGRISAFLVNKWFYAYNNFYKDPNSALALIESTPSYVEHHGYKNRAVSVEEARNFFEAEGIRVLDIYAVCGWIDVLDIPEEVQKSRDWDKKYKKLFEQTVEMVLKLGKEPSVKGMSKHLVLYGEKM